MGRDTQDGFQPQDDASILKEEWAPRQMMKATQGAPEMKQIPSYQLNYL